jgi:hypothetical protein
MLRKILLEFVRLNNKKESEEEEFRFTPKKLK